MALPNETALTIVKQGESQMAPFDVDQCLKLTRVAEKLFESKLFPNVGSAAGAFAVVQCGLELGLQPMQALNNIDVIKGKLCLNAKTMLSLMIRAGVQYEILQSDTTVCRMKFSRGIVNIEVTYTMEEAKAAGLIREGSGWTKYPADMLFARCVSRASRRIAPDAVQGLYTPEEMEDVEIKRGFKNAKNVTPKTATAPTEAPADIPPVVEETVEPETWELEWTPEEINKLEAAIHDTYECFENQPMWEVIKSELNIQCLKPLKERIHYFNAVKEYFCTKAAEAYQSTGKKVTAHGCVDSIIRQPMPFVDKFLKFRKDKEQK